MYCACSVYYYYFNNLFFDLSFLIFEDFAQFNLLIQLCLARGKFSEDEMISFSLTIFTITSTILYQVTISFKFYGSSESLQKELDDIQIT